LDFVDKAGFNVWLVRNKNFLLLHESSLLKLARIFLSKIFTFIIQTN